MKSINLKIDYRDLLDREDAEKLTEGKMLEQIKNIVEQSILSGVGDHTTPNGARFIGGMTARKLDRILDKLDESEDGTMTLTVKQLTMFQSLWTDRRQVPQAGTMRKIVQRIDRRICPDAYKEDDDADDDNEQAAPDESA